MPTSSPTPPSLAPAGPPQIPRIELLGLTRRLPSGERELTIVDAVDLAITAGEFVAVLGPSGSGKSTLLALMAGLDRPTAGEVRIDGRPISALSEDELALLRRHKIGFVFQSFQLLGNLTARENVLLPAELLGLADPLGRADELLAAVGLSDRGHHYPSQLSGGEQQRVALARAFAARPPILLADEPTGNLDAATGRKVLELMTELRRREGTTLVLVTHDPAVAALADRQIHLLDGRIERTTGESTGMRGTGAGAGTAAAPGAGAEEEAARVAAEAAETAAGAAEAVPETAAAASPAAAPVGSGVR
jgi:putative ABC transport system ATP-binding protein